MIKITPLNDLSQHLQRLIKGKLWLQVIIGIGLGAILGYFLNPSSGHTSQEFSTWAASWLDLPGKIFLKLVQMIMIPLIFASIISGIVSNSNANLRSMGPRLLIYFILTTFIAILIGTSISYIFQPGQVINEAGGFHKTNSTEINSNTTVNYFDNIPEAIANIIPDNPLEAMLTGEMLGIVIFTIIIGIAISQLKSENSMPIIRLIETLQKICMIIVSWAMLLIPYAVFGLIAALLSRIGPDVLIGLGYYILVVIFGLTLLLIVYLIIVFVYTKIYPWQFLKKIKDAQLLAFSTASSAAVMPLSMRIADEELGVSSNISDFVIPVGASINMDGTALFQCVTALFMAQIYGIDLEPINLVIITITIVAASIGTPAIPGGGVIILASVLQSVGIPTEGLIVIIGLDRILGMFRTAINVTGDLTACLIFNKWYGSKVPLKSNS